MQKLSLKKIRISNLVLELCFEKYFPDMYIEFERRFQHNHIIIPHLIYKLFSLLDLKLNREKVKKLQFNLTPILIVHLFFTFIVASISSCLIQKLCEHRSREKNIEIKHKTRYY